MLKQYGGEGTESKLRKDIGYEMGGVRSNSIRSNHCSQCNHGRCSGVSGKLQFDHEDGILL